MGLRHPITMENVIGNKVLVQLHRQAYESLDLQGVDAEKFVARVVGIDSFGLWIENPDYRTKPVYDDSGNYIAPEDRDEVSHRAAVLLQWPYIETILQFPDREAFIGGAEEIEIGFKSKIQPESGNG